MLLTVLGEFVLPAGGAAWTGSLVAAASALDIGEKNARQALARIGEQGLISSERHGRVARWSLTPRGREPNRTARAELRKRLRFLGFGEVSATLFVSPHIEREVELREVLSDLGLLADSVVLRSRLATPGENADLVERAWDLGELASSYDRFVERFATFSPADPENAFRATAELVHDWRRFPFIDPELPTELLPTAWSGSSAGEVFASQRAAWSGAAQRWFSDLEAAAG